ncbi:hypothetical protein [Nocardioides sp. NPDC047086]|uniref:hypothetical protein n=1 Tax=Nocardioides sp. NPDC047086 TaxID=3154810 RepID=UPI0033E6CED0
MSAYRMAASGSPAAPDSDHDRGPLSVHNLASIRVIHSIEVAPCPTPDARRSRFRPRWVRDFTCDHVLNGMVIGSRRDNRELYSITARDNDIEVELLWPGVKDWSSYPPLAYQAEIDRFRQWVVDQPSVDTPADWARWS